MTFRWTSPQAEIVVRSAWLIPAMVGLRSPFSTPWNWKPCRVVTRKVPLPCSSAIRSSPRYCSPLMAPAGTATRTMKL